MLFLVAAACALLAGGSGLVAAGLFLVGLFLLSASWRPLLTQITLFTLAHSITLGLSMFGIVSLPGSIVVRSANAPNGWREYSKYTRPPSARRPTPSLPAM